MYLKFSKNEILALEKLCAHSFGVGELARELGKKDSYASRLVRMLEEKGLVYHAEKRKIALSQASHAQSFRNLYISKQQAKIDEWLSGYSIGILILSSFNQEGVPVDIFWRETPCSKPTTYEVLKRLGNAGVMIKDVNTVRTTDRVVETFANDYATNIVRIATSQVKGLKVSIRVRLHVVVRNDSGEVPQEFVQTGINALLDYGLEAMRTSYSDYYLNLIGKRKKISVEEAFIHALLMTTLEQHQDKPVLALFLMKNRGKMNVAKLRTLAKQYAVEGELATMRDALDYVEKAI